MTIHQHLTRISEMDKKIRAISPDVCRVTYKINASEEVVRQYCKSPTEYPGGYLCGAKDFGDYVVVFECRRG